MFDLDNRFHQTIMQAGFGIFLLFVYLLASVTVVEQLPWVDAIIDAFIVQVTEQEMVEALQAALLAIFGGFFVAVIVGIPLGLAMGVNQFIEEFFDPYVNALYVMPIAALVPAFIIWFGTGLQIRLVIVFIFAVFPIVINTFEGAKTAPPNLIEAGKSFGAPRMFLIKKIVIPHEIPYILAGLRLGIGRSVKGLVVTEVVVAVTGLGGIIQAWSASYALEGVISVVLVLMVLGILLPWMLKQIHERLVYWDVSHS